MFTSMKEEYIGQTYRQRYVLQQKCPDVLGFFFCIRLRETGNSSLLSVKGEFALFLSCCLSLTLLSARFPARQSAEPT